MKTPLDHDWVYHGVVTDINIHNGEFLITLDNPQFEWQKRGLLINPRRGTLRVGDRVDVVYIMTSWTSTYEIQEIYPTDNPGKPSYEKVDKGRWYDHYLCCSKADQKKEFCVCSIIIECPVHGSRHIGTHD